MKKNKPVLQKINDFEKELTKIENEIHQTKNRSVQDPLNYGIKVNNRLAHLMVEEAAGDFPPTKQAEEVRQMLSGIVDEKIQLLKSTINENLDTINKMVKDLGIETVF